MPTCLVVGTDLSPRGQVAADLRKIGFEVTEAPSLSRARVLTREHRWGERAQWSVVVVIDSQENKTLQDGSVVHVSGRDLIGLFHEWPLSSRPFTLVIETDRPTRACAASAVRQLHDAHFVSLLELFTPLLPAPALEPAQESASADLPASAAA